MVKKNVELNFPYVKYFSHEIPSGLNASSVSTENRTTSPLKSGQQHLWPDEIGFRLLIMIPNAIVFEQR